ncbi:MAG: 3-phosphoshikimate 1-carboxyvinyltransferase [Clostridia bacterium]|nr:3-phosphoshikimate 1-carboxyvinyltransferase [Clostridia bacterium]
MIAKINPSEIHGEITAPPSKSMAHRFIICAALSKGVSVVDNIAYSDDIMATLSCIEALGAKVVRNENSVTIEGIDAKTASPNAPLYAGESGSTLRFLIPTALLSGNKTEFYGKERLFERPLEVYDKIAKENGLHFEKKKDGLAVCGPIKSGTYRIDENKSSQFISGLLFALPLLCGDSEIILSEYPESKPYIDMTLFALGEFGINVYFDGEKTFRIPGNQTFRAKNVAVEGDFSNAAFFEALNLVGGNVEVLGINKDTLQGDAVFFDYFEKIKKGNPTLDISQCPDLAPILMVLLSECGGGTLTGTSRLKFKESDRGEVMRCELSKLGAEISIYENSIVVANTALHAPAERIFSNGDHRVVMSMAVLLTKYGGSIIGCEDCKKSMPGFFGKLKMLGADILITE